MRIFKCFLFLFFLLTSLFGVAQITDSSRVLHDRIARSSYVWGFVRYHSVKKVNWNKEFTKLYKQAKSCKTDEKLNIFLNKWIAKYYIKNGCDLFIRDNSLIDFSLFFAYPSLAKAKTDTTLSIYKSNSYLPEYYNEVYEKDDVFPNEAQRVMALNKIYFNFLYFFPHFDMTVSQWDSLRCVNIPIFIQANTPLKYSMAINQLLANLNDGHISVYSSAVNQSYLKYTCPFRAHLSNTSAIIKYIDKDSFCLNNDIRLKDEIIKINGQNISYRYDFWRDKLPHSNEGNFLQIAEQYVLSDSVPKMNMVIKRGDSIINKSISLYEMGSFIINYDSISYKIISDSVGWINLSELKREEVPMVSKHLNSTKIVVIDARNYPNSTIDLLCSWLMKEPKPFAVFTKPQKKCLGEFAEVDTVFTEYKSVNSYPGKLVIICDASSVSQSEYSILALKTFPNSVVIGENSGGTTGYTTTFNLPGGIVCRMPVTSFRGLNFKVQGVGIPPDIQLKLPFEYGLDKEERIWKFILSRITL